MVSLRSGDFILAREFWELSSTGHKGAMVVFFCVPAKPLCNIHKTSRPVLVETIWTFKLEVSIFK